MSNAGIYRFYWDCGRNGDLSGIFIADADAVEKIQGKEVYFGEVLGKHSDIHGTIDPGEITLVSDKPSDVEVFARLGLDNGYNPFSYLGEDA